MQISMLHRFTPMGKTGQISAMMDRASMPNTTLRSRRSARRKARGEIMAKTERERRMIPDKIRASVPDMHRHPLEYCCTMYAWSERRMLILQDVRLGDEGGTRIGTLRKDLVMIEIEAVNMARPQGIGRGVPLFIDHMSVRVNTVHLGDIGFG